MPLNAAVLPAGLMPTSTSMTSTLARSWKTVLSGAEGLTPGHADTFLRLVGQSSAPEALLDASIILRDCRPAPMRSLSQWVGLDDNVGLTACQLGILFAAPDRLGAAFPLASYLVHNQADRQISRVLVNYLVGTYGLTYAMAQKSVLGLGQEQLPQALQKLREARPMLQNLQPQVRNLLLGRLGHFDRLLRCAQAPREAHLSHPERQGPNPVPDTEFVDNCISEHAKKTYSLLFAIYPDVDFDYIYEQFVDMMYDHHNLDDPAIPEDRPNYGKVCYALMHPTLRDAASCIELSPTCEVSYRALIGLTIYLTQFASVAAISGCSIKETCKNLLDKIPEPLADCVEGDPTDLQIKDLGCRQALPQILLQILSGYHPLITDCPQIPAPAVVCELTRSSQHRQGDCPTDAQLMELRLEALICAERNDLTSDERRKPSHPESASYYFIIDQVEQYIAHQHG